MSSVDLPEESDYVPQQIEFAVTGLTNYLPKDAIKEVFGALKNNIERFNYVSQLPEINKVVDLEPNFNEKDKQVAEDSRKEGNKFFQKENYLTAAQAYSKSLIYAPKEEENLALAYGNRSAAWLHLKRFEMSLADIQLAIQCNYPLQQRYKLYERQAKCYIALTKKADALNSILMAEKSLADNKATLNAKQLEQRTSSLMKMKDICSTANGTNNEKNESSVTCKVTGPSSTNTTWTSYTSKVDIEYKPDVGRDVISKQDIDVGEVLLVEKPFASTLLSDHYYNHCYECYSRPWAPVPCPECATVIYCSAECQQTSWKTHHKWECQYQNFFNKLWCGRIGHLAYRIIQKAEVDVVRACVEGISVVGEPDSLQVGIQDGKYNPDFMSIYSLSAKTSTRTAEGLFDYSVFAYFLANVLQKSGWMGTEDCPYVGAALIHLLQILQSNSHGILELLQPGDAEKPHPAYVGMGIYPSAALVNHSCYANADITYRGSTAVLRAVRHIFRGEAINIEYLGLNCLDMERSKRTVVIRANFGFVCGCIACEQQYPVWRRMDDQMPWFHCTGCRADLDVSDFKEEGEDKYVVCSKCGSHQDVGLAVRELQASHENFAKGMDLMLSGKHDDALPLLTTHLRTMQTYLSMPWKDLAACQRAVITCYRMKEGNIRKSFIDT